MVDDLTGFLMAEVIPPEPDALMDPRDDPAAAGSLRSTFSCLAQFPLGFGKSLFFFPKKPGIFNGLGLIGKGSKGIQAHVNPHGLVAGRERLRLHFAVEGHIPLTSGRAADGGRLGFATHLLVHDDLDLTDLRDHQPAVFEAAAGRNLGKGDRVIPALAFETGIAGLFTSFDAAEEGFEGRIDPDGDVLQNLGVGQMEIPGCFDSGQQILLNPITQGCLLNLPGVFALLQQTVVKIPALLQNSFEGRNLLLGGIKPVFESLKHLRNCSYFLWRSQRETA